MDDWDVKTIVLGYDGSEGAERAARLASAMARQNQARVLVVNVFHWSYSLDAMGERADQAADEAEAIAQGIVSRLQAEGIEASSEVVDGQAGEVLLRVAAAQNADLIVIGRQRPRPRGLAAPGLDLGVRRATGHGARAGGALARVRVAVARDDDSARAGAASVGC